MKEITLNDSISILGLDSKSLNILLNNNINTIEQLWKMKRPELKTIGLSDSQISSSIIKLQLNGIDLNGKINEKDKCTKKN